AKVRIGWDETSINAVTTARLLEEAGIAAVAVHGRTRAQGYSDEADWDVIAEVAAAVKIPVIGNGDITTAEDVVRRMGTGVRGVMIGRAAMSAPWIFSGIKHFLATGDLPPPLALEERWAHLRRHCRRKVEKEGSELHAMHAMRARLMAYSRGMPEARRLRERFAHVSSLAELDEIARENLLHQEAADRESNWSRPAEATLAFNRARFVQLPNLA
ncbi:MAG: tRNA-dihydrouridine synthase, partial [Verrucomicrobiota bacterium]|nr:tRNA-dihydrouridine synthase [Verrucomicrobiota bacterium]